MSMPSLTSGRRQTRRVILKLIQKQAAKGRRSPSPAVWRVQGKQASAKRKRKPFGFAPSATLGAGRTGKLAHSQSSLRLRKTGNYSVDQCVVRIEG